jgi:hypothetical protein
MGSYALGYYSAPGESEAGSGPLPPEVALGRMPTSIPTTPGFPGSGEGIPDSPRTAGVA